MRVSVQPAQHGQTRNGNDPIASLMEVLSGDVEIRIANRTHAIRPDPAVAEVNGSVVRVRTLNACEAPRDQDIDDDTIPKPQALVEGPRTKT